MKISVENIITNIKINILRNYPFYGHIIQQLPLKIIEGDNRTETMAVGKENLNEDLIKLYVSKDYVQTLFSKYEQERVVEHLREVIIHEILHIVFRHLTWRMPDRVRRNIACECSVNSYINRDKLIPEGADGKAGVFPEDFGLPEKQSVVYYYNVLKDHIKLDEMTLDSHELWALIKEDGIAEEMIKDIIRQAANTCNKTGSWGSIPYELKIAIEQAFLSKKNCVPWQTVLKNFVASASENILAYTMKRKSKRFGTRPGTRKEDILNLAIAIDTSGSVNNQMIELFFSELYWIAKTNAVITVFECDTKIHREYPFSQWDGKTVGRGGTDLEPVLKEVSGRRFDALIYFSDMEAPPIEEDYNIPILWVVNNSRYTSLATMPYHSGIFMKLSSAGESFELMQ